MRKCFRKRAQCHSNWWVRESFYDVHVYIGVEIGCFCCHSNQYTHAIETYSSLIREKPSSLCLHTVSYSSRCLRRFFTWISSSMRCVTFECLGPDRVHHSDWGPGSKINALVQQWCQQNGAWMGRGFLVKSQRSIHEEHCLMRYQSDWIWKCWIEILCVLQ